MVLTIVENNSRTKSRIFCKCYSRSVASLWACYGWKISPKFVRNFFIYFARSHRDRTSKKVGCLLDGRRYNYYIYIERKPTVNLHLLNISYNFLTWNQYAWWCITEVPSSINVSSTDMGLPYLTKRCRLTNTVIYFS